MREIQKLRISIGRPVEGDNFFAREHALQEHWETLQENNILLLSPRRVGKTSLMKKLKATAESNLFSAVYLSVEGLNTEQAFVKRLYESVIEAGSQRRKQIIDKLTKLFPKKITYHKTSVEFEASIQKQWRELGEALLGSLSELSGETRWLLMIDELPIFLMSLKEQSDDGEKRIREFLHWLRHLRQGTSQLEHIRWLFAGSIGLDTVTEELSLTGTINDLYPTELGAFDPETARELLQQLGHTYDLELSEEAQDRVLEKVRWPIPYFLQLVFSKVRKLSQAQRTSPTPDLVDEAFNELMSLGSRSYFDHWHQRLKMEFSTLSYPIAQIVLRTIAQSSEGSKRSTLSRALGQILPDKNERSKQLGMLLRNLEREGYIQEKRTETQSKYVFRSALLQEYWLRYYCD